MFSVLICLIPPEICTLSSINSDFGSSFWKSGSSFPFFNASWDWFVWLNPPFINTLTILFILYRSPEKRLVSQASAESPPGGVGGSKWLGQQCWHGLSGWMHQLFNWEGVNELIERPTLQGLYKKKLSLANAVPEKNGRNQQKKWRKKWKKQPNSLLDPINFFRKFTNRSAPKTREKHYILKKLVKISFNFIWII